MTAKIKTLLNKFQSSTLLKGLFILGFSGVLCKLIGVFYRVPLTNILGSEGMGIYGLIYPVYSLLLVISSTSLPLAISKIVSEKFAENDMAYISAIKKVALKLMIVVGGVLTLLLILFSKQIAILQGSSDASLGLILIAPSILIVALICVYRGVFQGLNNMKPTATSQLIEQGTKLILGLLFAICLLPFGQAYAVGGTMFGITLSEVLSLIYLMIKNNSNLPIIKQENKTISQKDVLKTLIKTTFPITISGLVIPVSLVIDSFLVVNLICYYGAELSNALMDYGLYTSVVNTIINVPIVVANALGIVVLPLIAKANKNCDKQEVDEMASKAIRLTFLICVPCVITFAFFATPIISLLYPNLSIVEIQTSSLLLVLSSTTVLSLSLFYISTLILQALGKNAFCIINCAIFCVLRIVIYFLLIQNYGIYALSVSSALSYLVMLLVNMLYLISKIDLSVSSLFNIFFKSLIFFAFSISIYLSLIGVIGYYAFIIAIILAGLIYLALNIKSLN